MTDLRGALAGPGGTYVGPGGGQVGPGLSVDPSPSPIASSQKTFLVHVYASDGTTLLATWKDTANFPSYNWPINGGPSALTLNLPRAWGSSGEKGESGSLNDLEFGNVVKIYVIDRESGEAGVLRYRGIIDEYVHDLAGQMVAVTLVPRTSYFKDRTLTTDVGFTATDPTAMAQYFITNTYFPGVTWDAANPSVGQIFNYTFKAPMKLDSVYSLCQSLSGANWYYRLNLDDSLTWSYWNVHTAPDHTLVIGRHVAANVRLRKTRMNYYQRVIMTGQETVTLDTVQGSAIATMQRPFSVIVAQPGYDPTVEPRDLFEANSRLTEASAAYRYAYARLEYFNEPFYETEIPVIDSNVDAQRGYDIESFKPGQVLVLRNPDLGFQLPVWGDGRKWGDGTVWGGTRVQQVQRPFVIANIDYQFDHCILTLRNRPGDIQTQLVEADDRLALVGA